MIDDLRFAWRRLVQAPGFTAAAVATLALAIGANTAIFSVADAVLFKPLPYADPDRVHVLMMADRSTGQRSAFMTHDYLHAVDDHHRGLSRVGIVAPFSGPVLSTDSGAERVAAVAVSANYFEILGARAARGRLFTSADATHAGRPVVLTYSSWKQRFGADPDIAGRTITLGTTRFDVVGVLPAGFVFPLVAALTADAPELITIMEPVRRGSTGGTLYPIVRRERDVTIEQAQAELDALAAARGPQGAGARPVLEDVRSVLYPAGRPMMKFLLASAVLVLLVGCANLANLFLARAKGGERDTGIRAALGADRVRLIRPLVFEALIVGLAGAVVSVAATTLTFDRLLAEVPRIAYRHAPVGVDLRVVVFALGLGLAGGLVFSIVPTWRSARLDVQALLHARRASGAPRRAFGRPMIAVQVAVAIVLVFGALMASRALLSVLRVPLGFSPENVLTIRVAPPRDADGPARRAFYVRALETVARSEGVVSAGAVGSLPLDGSAPYEAVRRAGSQQAIAGIVHTLPGYFETIGVSLVRGRLLNWTDVQGHADVAVIAESTARVLFPNADPLGGTFDNGRGRTFVVVGVASDTVHSLDRAYLPPAYVIPEDATGPMTLVVRTRARREAALVDVKRAVATVAPLTPVTAAWWADTIGALTAYRNPRFQTLVLGAFATLALGLTALGIFSIVAFLTAARTHEMGVRLAIGAAPRSLIAMIVRQTMIPVTAGLALGLVATRWASRLAEAQLFKVDTRDPLTLTAAVVAVAITAIAAAYLPARRVSRVDPIAVLRTE